MSANKHFTVVCAKSNDDSLLIDDYDLIDKDLEECLRLGREAYGITETDLSVVRPYEIHSILTVNI
ncbi:hypothetical protein ACFRAM_01410 [Paenibacillus sp. NPDC056722]|uniref:hypothetical protein n=1 Tax=Paenibacillus sp. NPDC056722 TaxID=3345924 RepID=UPI00368D6564